MTGTRDDLKAMAAELNNGDKLDIQSITGGLTNYSFKVATKNTTIYAKICFEFALWNPDRTVKYDLARVQNEFDMIKEVAAYDPCPVVTPYHCVDLVDDQNNNMKLLVTAWSKSDEQVRTKTNRPSPFLCSCLVLCEYYFFVSIILTRHVCLLSIS